MKKIFIILITVFLISSCFQKESSVINEPQNIKMEENIKIEEKTNEDIIFIEGEINIPKLENQPNY